MSFNITCYVSKTWVLLALTSFTVLLFVWSSCLSVFTPVYSLKTYIQFCLLLLIIISEFLFWATRRMMNLFKLVLIFTYFQLNDHTKGSSSPHEDWRGVDSKYFPVGCRGRASGQMTRAFESVPEQNDHLGRSEVTAGCGLWVRGLRMTVRLASWKTFARSRNTATPRPLLISPKKMVRHSVVLVPGR